MRKSFMYKSHSWFMGLFLFNMFWLFVMMGLDLILHKVASMPEVTLLDIRWGLLTLPAWTLLRLIFPFDAIVFVNKVQMAFDEAVGMDRRPEPEVWTELELEEEPEQERKPEPEKQKGDPV